MRTASSWRASDIVAAGSVSRSVSSGYYLGLLSGTSADGIDAAIVDFSGRSPRVIQALTQPLDVELRQRVLALMQRGAFAQSGASFNWPAINALDQRLGKHFAKAALSCIQQAGLEPGAICAIGLHGQTVFHQPLTPNPGSWQLGSTFVLAQATGIPVVSQFRQMDMALGGQGAPLAPVLHQALFARNDRDVAVVNLGGIANVSWLGRGGRIVGFDTGPANCLLDEWAQQHLGRQYDDGGRWAASGHVIPDLLRTLSQDDYFRQPAPKSTGRERFNQHWLQQHLQRLSSAPRPEDVQATLLELTAWSVAQAIDNLRQTPAKPLDVIVCGGGAHNQFLLDRLSCLLNTIVVSSARRGVDPDYLEAVLFAWLAKQRWQGQQIDLRAITGSSRPHLAGIIVRP